MKYKPVTKEVSEIGQINFSGNIIPEAWFQAIKHNGKTNVNAALILSEIVWWYRPQEIRDEGTGKLIATSRKFNGDLLQRSHQSFAHKFGITKKQSYDACKLLERLGLIELILIKSITLPSGDRIGNVLYIRVFPKKIMEITHPLSLGGDRVQPPSDRVQPPSDRVQPPSDRVQPPSDRVQPPSGTYTEITTEATPEISTETTNQDPLYPPRGDGSRTLDENFQNAKEGSPETELASFSNGSTHTREAKHNRKGSSRRAAAKKFPEQFDQWWMQYRQFCISTDKEAGDRAAAVKTWDLLIELEPEADIGRQVLEGSEWYAACKFQEYTAKGEAIGVPHGCRFLSKRKWAEALEHKAAKPDYLAKAKSLSCDADALWKQVFFAISGGDCEVPPIAKQAIASFGSMRELGNQSPEWIERVLKPKFFKEIQNAATSTP
jgi:hypothetical protein